MSPICNLEVLLAIDNLPVVFMKAQPNRIFMAVLRLAAFFLIISSLALRIEAEDTNLNIQVALVAAEKGDAKAQFELARYYEHERNDAQAVTYLRQSADQGYADAQILLGSFYGRGHGVPRNVATAVAWYRKAADQGNATAEYAMGNFYATGRGVTNDLTQAISWWQKAAAQNQADAEAALGELYLLPTDQCGTNYLNYAAAGRWLRQAAAHGSVVAMNNLGAAYENGLGVKTDFKAAAVWYRAAAEQGEALAQANLGQLYFDGHGVAFDLVQAYQWFKLSANQGNSLGIIGLGNFRSHALLTPKQLAAAEQLVRDFQPRQSPNHP